MQNQGDFTITGYSSYAANVELTAVVPVDHCEQFELQVVEAFNAAVSPEPIDMVNIPVPLA